MQKHLIDLHSDCIDSVWNITIFSNFAENVQIFISDSQFFFFGFRKEQTNNSFWIFNKQKQNTETKFVLKTIVVKKVFPTKSEFYDNQFHFFFKRYFLWNEITCILFGLRFFWTKSFFDQKWIFSKNGCFWSLTKGFRLQSLMKGRL